MQSRPPMEYKKAMVLAEKVTRSYNGRQDRLWNKTNLYSSNLNARSGRAESEKLEIENRTLRTEVGNLRRSLKGIIPHKGGGHKERHSEKTPPRRSEKRGKPEDNKDFFEDRKEVSAAIMIDNC